MFPSEKASLFVDFCIKEGIEKFGAKHSWEAWLKKTDKPAWKKVQTLRLERERLLQIEADHSFAPDFKRARYVTCEQKSDILSEFAASANALESNIFKIFLETHHPALYNKIYRVQEISRWNIEAAKKHPQRLSLINKFQPELTKSKTREEYFNKLKSILKI